MYQTRASVTKKLPIPRKGTKYIARSLVDLENSVPVVVAVRDMLKLARTAKEIKKLIKQKALKINGKEVKDYRDSIRLFNILEAGRSYVLTLTPTGKFTFEENKNAKERICKVTNKIILKGGKVQLNLHDGSNVLSSEKINVGDSIYLDFSGKIKKQVSFEKDRNCFIISGKYVGSKGKIDKVDNNRVKIKLEKNSTELEKNRVVVI